MVFRTDVDSRIAAQNSEQIATQRTVLAQGFESEIEAIKALSRDVERQRIAEAAGLGPSGRYGRGPAVRTIELRLEELRQETEERRRAREQALAEYDRLTPREADQRYGLGLSGNGLRARGVVLDEILEEDSHRHAETAIRAFLAFLFLALVILKLFQPRSVEIYFSEQLQSLYDRYLAGAFDGLLPDLERSSGPLPMDALCFEAWCLSTYGTQRIDESEQHSRARRAARHEERIASLRRVAQDTSNELEPLRQRRRKRNTRIGELGVELERLTREVEEGHRRLERQCRRLAAIEDTLRNGELNDNAFQSAARIRQEIVEASDELARSLRSLQSEEARLARERESLISQQSDLEQELAGGQSLLHEIESRIRSARQDWIDREAPELAGAREPNASDGARGLAQNGPIGPVALERDSRLSMQPRPRQTGMDHRE